VVLHGHHPEGADRFERAVAAAKETPETLSTLALGTAPAWAAHLAVTGFAAIITVDLAIHVGDLERAADLAERAHTDLSSSGEVWGTVQILSRLSRVAELRGRRSHRRALGAGWDRTSRSVMWDVDLDRPDLR
jgi:hypothetical protein